MSYLPKDPAVLFPRVQAESEKAEWEAAGARWRAMVDRALPGTGAAWAEEEEGRKRRAREAAEKAEREREAARAAVAVRAEGFRYTMSMRPKEIQDLYRQKRKASSLRPKDFDARTRALVGDITTASAGMWLAAAIRVEKEINNG